MLPTLEDFDPRPFLDAELRESERTNSNTLCKVLSCEKLPFTISPNRNPLQKPKKHRDILAELYFYAF